MCEQEIHCPCTLGFSDNSHTLNIIRTATGHTHFLTMVVKCYLSKINNSCTEFNGYKTVHELSEA